MKRSFIGRIVGRGGGLLAGLLLAISASADQARDELISFIESASSYSAYFTQELLDEQGQQLETATGQFWLERPGKFRWHYDAPLERLLISDGIYIWLYDVELDQVTKRNADGELEKTPAGVLVGDASALDNYQLSVRSEQGNYIEIGMQPLAGSSDFADIVLGLDNGQLAELRLADRFAQTTVIRFRDTLMNPGADDSLFVPDLPDYVDVIDQTQSSGVP